MTCLQNQLGFFVVHGNLCAVGITIHKAAMFIADVCEEMCALSWDEYWHSNAFDGGITPPMVVDATFPVNVVNVAAVVSWQPRRHARHLKVVVEDIWFRPFVKELWFDSCVAQKFLCCLPQPCNAYRRIQMAPHIAIIEVVTVHEAEHIVFDGS